MCHSTAIMHFTARCYSNFIKHCFELHLLKIAINAQNAQFNSIMHCSHLIRTKIGIWWLKQLHSAICMQCTDLVSLKMTSKAWKSTIYSILFSYFMPMKALFPLILCNALTVFLSTRVFKFYKRAIPMLLCIALTSASHRMSLNPLRMRIWGWLL